MVEGDAVRVTDEAQLGRVAERYEAKYGPAWHYVVRDGMIVGQRDNVALVFAVIPTTAFGGGYAQTMTRVSAS